MSSLLHIFTATWSYPENIKISIKLNNTFLVLRCGWMRISVDYPILDIKISIIFSSSPCSCLHSYLDIVSRYSLIYLDIRISPCRVSAVWERPAATECCSAAVGSVQRLQQNCSEEGSPALYIVITATEPTAPAPHQPTTPPQPTSQTAVARVINTWHQCQYSQYQKKVLLLPSPCRKRILTLSHSHF